MAGVSGGGGTAGVLGSTISENELEPNAVTTARIADGAVTTGKLADGAVTAAKLDPALTSVEEHVAEADPHTQYATDNDLSAHTGKFRAARVTTGAVGGGATVNITVTFASAFADANYTVVASVLETQTTSTLTVRKVVSQAVGSVVVRVENQDAVNARTGTLHVIAIHD